MPAVITEDPAAFLQQIGPSGRLLGLDLGSKTLGLALTDPARMIASPHTTLKRGRFSELVPELAAVISDFEIVGLVLGLPKNLDGTSGPRVQATRAFARNLAGQLSQPILLWDERLTTAEAERMLIAADTSRRKRGQVIDQIAAALILKSAIDRLTRL